MKAYNLETAIRHSPEITELYLHHCGLSEWPEVVFQCPRLRVLELSRNPLSRWPDRLEELQHLEALLLPDNEFGDIPQALGRLSALRRLDLGGNRLRAVPDFVFSLSALQLLSLQGNQLEKLPAGIGYLKDLQVLRIGGNALRRLPAEIGQLSAIQEFDASNNRLRDFPPGLDQLKRLERLDLSGNRLRELPASAPLAWPALQRLLLGRNALRSLPQELGQCSELRRLDLSHNRLEELPASLGQLSWLTDLLLGQNRLEQLPEEIGRLHRLQTLDLSQNRLKRLPGDWAGLSRLEQLRLNHNQLSTLPMLPAGLRLLDLAHNQVGGLPQALRSLPRLQELSLAHNELQGEMGPEWRDLRGLRRLLLNGNDLRGATRMLMYFDALESYRGPLDDAADQQRLLRFRRACRREAPDDELRQALFEVLKGNTAWLSECSTAQLLQALRFGLREVALAVRSQLIETRGKPLIENPLGAGAAVVLLGQTPFQREPLRRRLEALGLQLQQVADASTTHLVVDLSPGEYEVRQAAAQADRLVFLSPAQLQAFIDQAGQRPLASGADPVALERLRQLLHSPALHNVRLAISLLQGGGIPVALLTDLFVAWKRNTDPRLRKDLRRLLELGLPETDRRILSYRYSLDTQLPAEVLERNIRHYTEGTALEEGRLRELLGDFD